MPTDKERREVARRLRGAKFSRHSWERCLYDALEVDTETAGSDMLDRLADLIEPSCDLGPSGWTSFDKRPPEPGAPVLCKGKNGVYYVGKPVTFDGELTGKVWVPRGAEYRSPAAWRPVDSPPCDRDALLELADELEEDACWGVQSPGVDNYAWMLKDVCDRIREAIGVKYEDD